MTAVSFTFKSSDGKEIFAMKWSPEDQQKPKAAVQIAHGYAEHIGRYDVFARKLAEAGIVVYGNDHRGHGKTNGNAGEAICFADEAGFDKVVADMRALRSAVFQYAVAAPTTFEAAFSGATPPVFRDDVEVELDCDPALKYRYAMEAITSVTGYLNAENQIVKMVEKVKFTPPAKG